MDKGRPVSLACSGIEEVCLRASRISLSCSLSSHIALPAFPIYAYLDICIFRIFVISDKALFYLFYLQRLQRGLSKSAIRDTSQTVFNQRPVKNKIMT